MCFCCNSRFLLPQELPHYYFELGKSDIFQKWSKDFLSTGKKHPIIGAWKRPLFAGKWDHSTDEDEIVFNVQTSTLFVDLRIPRNKPVEKWERMGKQLLMNDGASSRRILESLSNNDLRLYARQHVFGGFSKLSSENNRDLCTRHHCIDWNYIPGKPRPRPNKWYIEGELRSNSEPYDAWIEWSYATDENGQSYYKERWERLVEEKERTGLRLALRKSTHVCNSDRSQNDGILVAVNDHFNYMLGRDLSQNHLNNYPSANNLVELVDAAIANGDRGTAISYLSLEAGHGKISSGWVVDCSIQPWKHGMTLANCISDNKQTKIKVTGTGSEFHDWRVFFGGSTWLVYECSLSSASELESLLKNSARINLDSRL